MLLIELAARAAGVTSQVASQTNEVVAEAGRSLSRTVAAGTSAPQQVAMGPLLARGFSLVKSATQKVLAKGKEAAKPGKSLTKTPDVKTPVKTDVVPKRSVKELRKDVKQEARRAGQPARDQGVEQGTAPPVRKQGGNSGDAEHIKKPTAINEQPLSKTSEPVPAQEVGSSLKGKSKPPAPKAKETVRSDEPTPVRSEGSHNRLSRHDINANTRNEKGHSR